MNGSDDTPPNGTPLRRSQRTRDTNVRLAVSATAVHLQRAASFCITAADVIDEADGTFPDAWIRQLKSAVYDACEQLHEAIRDLEHASRRREEG